jgi:hypothetical protein
MNLSVVIRRSSLAMFSSLSYGENMHIQESKKSIWV